MVARAAVITGSSSESLGSRVRSATGAPLTPESDESEPETSIGISDDEEDAGKSIPLRSMRHSGYDSDAEGEAFLQSSRRRARRGTSDADGPILYTRNEEQVIVKKLDRRVTLFVALLYLLSFLDRSNIGNAKVAGLMEDLKLTSPQYEQLLTAFYVTYILFEWMTILYRYLRPHVYISLCVLSWGLLASLQSVATSFRSLLFLRTLLGIGEAGFGPGVPFYLSFFYKRDELAFRTGLFISAAPLATSFAGSLAYFITKHSGGPIAPWRMLFLVEGFPGCIAAVLAWSLIPDRPSSADFLNRRQQKIAKQRLKSAKSPADDTPLAGSKWRELAQTLLDPQCYLMAMMFLSCNVAFSSLPVFLPTIIHQMGYTPQLSQALTAPLYLVAFVGVLVTAFLSDRFRARSAFICFHALLGGAGYAFIAVCGILGWPNSLQYLALYPAAVGFFSAITIIITWTINNQRSDSRKAAGLAFLNLVGQCGPLIGTHLYPDEDAPLYTRGMTVCAAFMFGVFFLSFALRRYLIKIQRSRAEKGFELMI